MHLRAEIKAKIIELLKNKTTGIDRVYQNRFMPISEENLPSICVYAITENVSIFDNLTDKRVLEIAIECLVDGENADSDLDILTNQVESIFIQDETLQNLVHKTELVKTEIGYDEKSQSQMQAGKLSYQVIYFTDKTSEAVDNLGNVKISYENFENLKDDVNMPQN
jgi:hypothetical protein